MSLSSGTTSVPAPSLTDAGYVTPDESDILTGVQADINAALGGNANPALSTPQGQLAMSETAIIGDQNDQILAVLNGVDPNTASGRMQDAIGAIYFLTREPATSTIVNVMIVGAVGATIAPGTPIAWDGTNTYAPTASLTIPSSGTLTASLSCTATGPIPCAAGALSLYQGTGLTSVSNTAEGVLGSNVETRAAFEARRSATVAANSVGSNAAILASILAVNGVQDAYVVDNENSASQVIGGVTLKANSVYCSVVGGAPGDIGLAIIKKKPPGCGYTGSTSVLVQDPAPAYGGNGPTYTVSYDVAAPLAIYVGVTISNSNDVPSTALSSIQSAVIAAFSGTDGGTRAKIGSTIYASRFYPGIAALGPWAKIVEIAVGTSPGPTGFTVPVNINQAPTVATANITLTLV